MKTLYRKWNCWKITSNNRYVAALGSGITILTRETFDFVHHFSNIRYIHGGFFLNDDILVVFTGEQHVHFLHISEKKLLWTCPRSKQLASSGDIRCCQIPGTKKVACIATGKLGLNQHYFLLIDYDLRTVHLQEIPDCCRVIHSLIWTPTLGLTCLSYEAKDHNVLLYRIISLAESGDFSTLCEWESSQLVNAYSGNYLFMNDHSNKEPHLRIYKIIKPHQSQNCVQANVAQLEIMPFFYANGLVGDRKIYLPSISWIDEASGLLVACTTDWLGVYDFLNEQLISEYNYKNIACVTVIDENLFIGCTPGLVVKKLFFPTSP